MATLWTDTMILDAIYRRHGLTGPAYARALELATAGLIDTRGVWALTPAGRLNESGLRVV